MKTLEFAVQPSIVLGNRNEVELGAGGDAVGHAEIDFEFSAAGGVAGQDDFGRNRRPVGVATLTIRGDDNGRCPFKPVVEGDLVLPYA